MVATQFTPSPLLAQTPPASKIYNTYGLYLRRVGSKFETLVIKNQGRIPSKSRYSYS